jgi:hypothetical protein
MSAPEDRVDESPLERGSETFNFDFAKYHVNAKFRHL